MFKKILALTLILAMLFSFAACKSSTEEEEAMAGELVEDNSDTTPDDNSSNNNDNNNNNNDNTNQTPGNSTQQPDNNNNNNNDNKEEDNTPPLSTEGSYTVTFDFGYDNKSESEKTDGKVTQMDISRPGYKFDGWFDGSDKFDFSKEVSADTTLTAKWSIITYNITYKAEGATLPSGNPSTYTVEDEVKLEAPTMAGKAFLGWSIDNGKNLLTSTVIAKGTTGDLTLSPVWDENAVILGRYEQDGNEENGAEPIQWIKIKEENGKALLISKFILDAKQYDATGGANIKWATCGLRKWLNDSFYKSAFLSDEKEAIVQTEIYTPHKADNSTSNDYVFLLSIEESKELLSSYAARSSELTPYAEANGAQNSPKGGWWWLRTKISDYGAALIENDGNIRDIGYNGNMKTIGIRPCIWVDTAKIK
ncbi:MAG: InlB B-repeat-containing protein [Clostridia bacterium]|nr:InlB B-repeat-containing protein [Clostridia bacterium]